MARNMKCSDTGKDVHFTERHAKLTARLLGEKASRKLYTYRCPKCSFWHLTHQDRAGVRESVSA